jgi:hypothetical protein
MDDQAAREQRRNSRLRKPFVLRLKKPDIKPVEWDYILVDDISKGGLSFRSEDMFRVGEVLDLKIYADKKRPVVICKGQVVRTRRKNVGGFVAVALVVVDLSSEKAEWLDRLARQRAISRIIFERKSLLMHLV